MNCFVFMVLASLSLSSAKQFNRFKSYEHERIQPNAYSKYSVHHPITDYLTPAQKRTYLRGKQNLQTDLFDENDPFGLKKI